MTQQTDFTPDCKTKLTICYDGSDFHGWQVQKQEKTVQGTLQEALFRLSGKALPVTGCSRTDAGVHALNYVCHTDYISVPCDKIPIALNALLPPGISVKKAEIVSADFHARYSCTGKEYIYKIFNNNLRDPFLENRAMFYPKELDHIRMNSCAGAICGKNDFCSFMAQGSDVKDTVRTVKYCDVSKDGEIVTIRVAADGFLYNMVRIIAGTLIRASEKQWCENDILDIITSHDRTRAGFTAPPHALYLNKVFYD